MRRRVVALAALSLAGLPATAAAQSGGAAAPDSSGGATYGASSSGPGLVARSFTVSPGTVKPGRALTIAFRIDGRVQAARVRVDLLPADATRAAATLRLGHRRTNHRVRVRWRPKLAPGAYTARLSATAVRSRHRARITTSDSVRVGAPVIAPAPPPAGPAVPVGGGVFPVQGTWTFGGPEDRFGAPRAGHSHQGQDILAPEGTPVVAPLAGTITWRAYQAAGAGYYVVLHGADGRDYVFMHFQDGSLVVDKGDTVAAGQRLANVGQTGDAEGPHLHFEIWPGGWYADGSQPIDPLPFLLTLAGSH
jgi:murein DD-endopeptidase MepM/ murein hydrolase activator NlpD